jgi:23S rRNA pseudouridine2605 synthase
LIKERIQKVLAQAGYGSRREIEGWIRAGRLSLDDKPLQLGDKNYTDDPIYLDGKLLPLTAQDALSCRILAYHKPEGEVCTRSDPEHRPTVFKHLPQLQKGRWIMIGRLDINTSGLLLFTTNGELANRLMHPKYQIEREYAVRVFGEVSKEKLETMLKGVILEDGLAKFSSITLKGGEGRNQWFHVVLQEGRNREVRRLWESQDVMVSRLTRVRFDDIQLERTLKQGQWRDLLPHEIKALGEKVGLSLSPYSKKKFVKSFK